MKTIDAPLEEYFSKLEKQFGIQHTWLSNLCGYQENQKNCLSLTREKFTF